MTNPGLALPRNSRPASRRSRALTPRLRAICSLAMWRRRQIVIGVWIVCVIAVATLLVVVPPNRGAVTWIGSRTDRATMVQAVLTALALIVTLIALVWEVGAPPRLRLTYGRLGAVGTMHYNFRAEALSVPVNGLRIEVRLPHALPYGRPETLNADMRGGSWLILDADNTGGGWVPVFERVNGEEAVLGWDFQKNRLEPSEASPILHLYTRTNNRQPDRLVIRWWSERTGPTVSEITPGRADETRSVDSRGN